MPSVKKNFSYNLVLTLCGYIFPFITYPYVSRVLGVSQIGICNFADSIISYFVLFSMLGIGSYGIREIARVRHDNERRNYVFSNLVILNLFTTTIAIIILLVCTFTIPKFIEYKPFLLVGVAKILSSMFLIEWFYQGIQDFRYITIRSLFVRVLYVIAVFVFVHDEQDALVYFSLTAFTTIINALINWLYSRRHVRLSLSKIELKVFLVPVLTFGYYRVLTSMYTTFNTVFLGFTSGDIEVGYFATATKLYGIIMSVLSAFTTVMIPRVSELLHDGNKEKLQWIADQTMSIISAVSLPVIILCLFCAPDIIRLLSGPGYEGAITPFRIVIFLLLIIGTEQVLIQQFLMAATNNQPILIVSTIGAITGVLLNLVITPRLGSIGSAIAWGVSELAVLSIGILFVKKNLGIVIPIRLIATNILRAALYVIPLLLISTMHLNMWLNLLSSGIVTVLMFVCINLWINENHQISLILKDAKVFFARKH